MADQNDGSIIIDCELDTDGLKSGSRELLEAIKSLSDQVKTLGDTIKNTFSGSGQAAQAAVGDVQKYQRTIEDLRREIEQLRARSGGSLGLDFDSSSGKASNLQKEIDAVARSAEKLGPTFQKALAGDGRAIATLQAKLGPLASQVESLKAKLAQAGAARIPTEEYTFLAQEMQKAEVELNRLLDRQAKMRATGVSHTSKQWKNLQYDIDLARQKIQTYKAEQDQLAASGASHVSGASTPAYANMSSMLSAVSGQVQRMNAALSRTGAQMNATSGTASRFVMILRQIGRTALTTVGGVAKNAFISLAGAIKQAITRLISLRIHFNKAHKSTSRFGGGLKGLTFLLKQMLMFRVFSMIFEGIITGMNNLAQYSSVVNKDLSTLKSSLTQLKNSFATAFAPILSVVTPILAKLINMLSQAITLVGKFIAALTGAKTFTQAKAVQEDYAASLKKTGSAAKEAKRQLAGFDELNVLNDTSSAGSGADAGTVDPSQMFEEVPIDSSILKFVARLKEAFANGEYAEIGRIIGEKINEVFQTINDFISWDRVGEPIKKYINIFCEIFNSLVDTIDWALIGDTFAQGINTIVNTLYYLLTGIDWENLGRGFGEGLNGLVYGVDWERLGQTIGAYLMAALNVIYGAITTFDWKSAGKSLGTCVMSLWSSIDWAKAGSALSTAVKGVLNSITEAIKAVNWQQVGNDIASFIAGVDWSGTVSALSEGIGAALGGLTSLILGFVQPAWESVVQWWYDNAFEDGQFTIKGLLSGVGKGLVGIGMWIWDNILVPFCEGFDAASGGLLTSLWETLKGVWQSLVDWWYDVAYEDGKFTMDGLMLGILEVFCNIGQWISDNIFTPFVNGFKKLFQINSPSVIMRELGGYLIEGLFLGITSAWSSITSFFATALPGVTEAVSNAWGNVKTWTSEAWGKASSTVSSAWSTVKTATVNAAKTVKEKVSDAWSSVKENISDKIDSAKEIASKVWDKVLKKADDTCRELAAAVGIDWDETKKAVLERLDEIKAGASKLWDAIKSTTKSVNNGIKTLLTSDWNTIKTQISNSLNNIKSTASSAWNTIKSTVSSASSSIQSKINSCWSSAASSIRSKLSSISSNMSSTFNSLVSNAYTWGKHICDNLYSGISSGISKVVNAAKSLASSIRSYIGFSEPEKGPLSDFHTYMPDMIDLMVKGINDNKSRAVSAISGVAAAISDEVQNGDYGSIGISTDAQSGITGFSDKIVAGFAELMNRLQAIADGVSFAAPKVANGAVPYSVSAAQNSSGVSSGNTSNNEDIGSVVIQSVNNATVAIVKAIEEYSQTNVNIDSNSLADSIINEINRRTRMTGKSPLLT